MIRNIIIIIGIVVLSSCATTKVDKECCKKTAQEVYKYEGLTSNINK